MKKKKSNKFLNFIFIILLLSFLVVYFSEITGYYEFQNHKQTVLTEEQIKQYEKDIASGKEIDLIEYLSVDTVSYKTNLSKIMSKISEGISKIVQSGVETTFKFLSNLVEG